MKKIFLILSALTLCVSLAFASSEYIILKDKINVRVDSTALSDSLGYILKNQKVNVLKEKYGWYEIRLPKNFICYIAKDLTRKISNSEIKVIGSKVNLRSSPTLEAHIIGVAPKGAKLKLLDEKGQWMKIYGYPYIKGWVHSKFSSACLPADF